MRFCRHYRCSTLIDTQQVTPADRARRTRGLSFAVRHTMTDSGREAVKRRLESFGFKIDIIQESPKDNRPDLRTLKDGITMFVEVKTRTEDAQLRKKMESVALGETEAILTSLDKHNSLSSDIEKANAQLGAIASAQDLRLLWFLVDNGLFVYDACEQMKATLLGLRMVFGKRSGKKQTRPCCYAAPADFFRYQEIDGAIIEQSGELILIPNQFSPRKTGFTNSPIYKAVAPAILDIRQAELEGAAYVIDGAVDRKNDAALLDFLRKKYPGDDFFALGLYCAGTVVTTIDARRGTQPDRSA